MFTEITLEQAKGKQLQGYAFSFCCEQTVLVFTDSTFTTLGIDHGYTGEYSEIMQSALRLNDFGDTQLISCGIITQEEVNVIRDSQRK